MTHSNKALLLRVLQILVGALLFSHLVWGAVTLVELHIGLPAHSYVHVMTHLLSMSALVAGIFLVAELTMRLLTSINRRIIKERQLSKTTKIERR